MAEFTIHEESDDEEEFAASGSTQEQNDLIFGMLMKQVNLQKAVQLHYLSVPSKLRTEHKVEGKIFHLFKEINLAISDEGVCYEVNANL